MQIMVKADKHVGDGEKQIAFLESLLEGAFGRFGEKITRMEVYLTDENGGEKEGGNDKRCVLEAKVAGHPPFAVTHQSGSIDEAIDGAVDKLEKLLDRTFDRLENPKGRTSFAGDQSF